MGVADFTYDRGMVEAALFRSGGTGLARYAYGPALPPSMRNPKSSGKGVGHVYIHVKGSGDDLVGEGSGRDDRSLFADTAAAVGAIVEIMTHTSVRAALRRLDQDPKPNEQEWIKSIPLANPWYGYEQHSNVKKKIATCAINMRSHGDALFISSCYPDSFQTN